MRRVAAIILLLLPIGQSLSAARDVFTPPVVVVRKLAERPKDLDAAAAQVWRMPVSITGMRILTIGVVPSQATDVRLAYDDVNFYAAFTCQEDRMAQLRGIYPKHDDMVWRDDSVSIFLDTKRDRKRYFHLCAGVTGARFEARGSEAGQSWDGVWEVRTEKRAQEWRAFVAVPFTSLGAGAPKGGTVWGANFCRQEQPHAEKSLWSPVRTTFHEPDRFGELVFVDAKSPVVSAAVPEITSPGRHSVSLNISAGRPLDLTVQALCDGQQVSAENLRMDLGTLRRELRIRFPCQGRHSLSIAVENRATGALLYRTPPVLCRIPDHLVRLDRMKATIDRQKNPSAALGRERTVLSGQIAASRKAAVSAQGKNAAWAALTGTVDKLERLMLHFRAACADTANRGYVLGSETALRKLLRDEPFDGPIGTPAGIELARNEYESAQVVIDAYDRALQDVQVTVSGLVGPGGTAIPADSIELKRVDFVQTRKPCYEVEYVGWYPDPLMDLSGFDVPKGRFQPIWVTVRCPKGVPAGLYRGTITVRPANAPSATLPLEVKVWDFALGDEMHMRTAFALFDWLLGAWYGKATDEIRRDYLEMLLAHRLSPANIYSSTPSPAKDDMRFCVERGLNAFCLGYIGSYGEKSMGELDSRLRDYKPYLDQNDWWRLAYIYGFDEVKKDKYADLKAAYGCIHERYPDLPRMCTVAPNDDLKGFVDVWVPLTANFVPEDAAERVRYGDTVWWYVCCVPAHPYANFFIDYPATDPRVLFWMNWKYHVPGFLYYAVNMWESNRVSKNGKRWPDAPWNTFTFDSYNGDGQLVYPGPNGPLSSIRLESIRDGIEDYEYLYLLDKMTSGLAAKAGAGKEIAQARKLLAVDSRVVTSLTDYTDDPHVVLSARREIAAAIERMSILQNQRGGTK